MFTCYNIIAFLSCLMMQYLSFSTLFLGKLINGISVTIVNIAALKMINETVPLEYMGSFGNAYAFYGSIGSTLLSLLGTLLPEADYNPALTDDPVNEAARLADLKDHYWRLQTGFPMLVNLYMLAFFTFYINEEPIMFNLSAGKDEGAEILAIRV